MKNNSTLLHLGLIIMVLITSCNDKLDVTQDNVRGKSPITLMAHL